MMTAWAYCNAEMTIPKQHLSHRESVIYPMCWQRFRDSNCVDQVSICSGSTVYMANNGHPQSCVTYRLQKNLRKCEELNCDFVTMLRSILYALPKYEAQEITTLFAENTDEHGDTDYFSQPEKEFILEDICDDFDDSSSDGYDSSFSQPVHLSALEENEPNIYGLVKKATKTVKRSWSSFNQLRKNSFHNIVTNFPNGSEVATSMRSNALKKIGRSARWKSFNAKLHPIYSTFSTNSASVFYLDSNELRANKMKSSDGSKLKLKNGDRGRKKYLDSSLARPSSPPPPPPNLEKFMCSDSVLPLHFANEPLYQFYTDLIIELNADDPVDYEEVGSVISRPSAMELITPSRTGHGHCRSLWCEVTEVRSSGILDVLNAEQQRLQEAKFEVITSEASYYKSLSVLNEIFVCNNQLQKEAIISKNDWKTLFGNVSMVRKCSEMLLLALEKCWQESIMLTGLSDIIYEQASANFGIFVKYCSNQVYIDRTLKRLRKENPNFIELIHELESNSACQSLTLHSFLMLPMQRITRMPLLVDAILSRMDPTTDNHDYKTLEIALATINQIVKECNENARKFERYEEMLLLSRQLEFSRMDVKMFSVASSSRWLVRSGSMIHINPQDAKSTFTRKLIKQTNKLHFFLFNDVLVITKKRKYNSEYSFIVIDHCHRNVMQMSAMEDVSLFFPVDTYPSYKYLLLLTILENHQGKMIEMVLSCDSDSTRQRWLEATSFSTPNNSEEKLYEEWDCPQVLTKHVYVPKEPDELSLQIGDVVKVLKKTTDGWYHGERIRDGVVGWFPGNHTVEVASQHTRAKNLKSRHRLLMLSANYIQNQQKI